MKNDLSRSIDLAEARIRYDAQVKRVLGQKSVLAWILRRVVEDFGEMEIEEIIPYIEGDPEIGSVAVHPGETNAERISGLPNEDKVTDEGVVYYDVRFYVTLPGTGERTFMIVNVEAQKDFYPGYEIVTRGIFYVARMISAQLGTVFEIPNYDGIKKAVSIWICMDAPGKVGNAISEYSIEKKDLFRALPDKRNAYDKMSVIMITLHDDEDCGDEFITMMNTLLGEKTDPESKKKALQDLYGFQMESNVGKELDYMCNLSELVAEKGIEKGIEKGQDQVIGIYQYLIDHLGASSEDAAKELGCTVGEVSVIRKRLRL